MKSSDKGEKTRLREYKRHVRAFSFFHALVTAFFVHKFNYVYDDLKDVDGPYLLLSNHNMDYDPILVGIAAKNQLYFVASEHIMRKGIATKFIMRFFKPIIHRKGKMGLKSVGVILKTLKEGKSVAMFPEGNRSFNGITGEIPDSTGKLVKKSGVKLVTFTLEGGYFTQPRWGMSLRKGKVTGNLKHIYTPEELSAMTEEEVNAHIQEDLFVDAYAFDDTLYLGKNPALGMETALFACPLCRKIGRLGTSKTALFCRACNANWEWNPLGRLKDVKGTLHSISEFDLLQRELLKKRINDAKAGEVLFEDEVSLYKIDGHTALEEGKGKLVGYKDCISVLGKTYKPEDLQGVAVFSRNTLTTHTVEGNMQLEIRGNEFFNALKYRYLYEMQR